MSYVYCPRSSAPELRLYTCSPKHLADFKVAHPEIKTGKGCINFRDRDAIPEAAVSQVIEHAMRHPKGSAG